MSEITTESIMDANGNCIHHAAIKIQRQTASGSWKSLLSSCPLCSVRGTTPPRRTSTIGRVVGNVGRRSSSGRDGTTLYRSGSSSGTDNDTMNELRRLSSSHSSSRSIVGDRVGDHGHGVGDVNVDGDDQGNDHCDNDYLSPLQSHKVCVSTHDISMQPPLCKQISALSISSSTDRTDATVASSCSASSSQHSSSAGGAWRYDEISPLGSPPLNSLWRNCEE
mmetsp:Transcript_31046/g.65533  ORF Transcript_31046/g.65533 Transcript_31046/m.65533 type:complete len:222 (-) Transcript_31046:1315-1980(-)